MNFSNGTAGVNRLDALAEADKPNFPEEYSTLKRKLVPPENEADLVKSWAELLQALDAASKEIAQKGSEIIPQVEFSDLAKLSDERKAEIRRTGSLVIRNVVDDEVVLQWKEDLKKYVEANPQAKGYPEHNKQFFELYWSKSQVAARSHPNVIEVQGFLNALWSKPKSPDTPISLSVPLAYADCFRMRQPNGEKWGFHPPHQDGPRLERWADDNMRQTYASIFKGKWKEHDPFQIEGRVSANPDISKRLGRGSSGFRSWQGWLAMSNTGPGEGTLRVFPRVQLSNAYHILRPFFRLKSPDADPLLADSWVFEASTAHFPGMQMSRSTRFNEYTHPNLRTDSNMTSMPRVYPGDMVFWHCDVIHAVEEENNGPNDSSVMYIPAMPMTLQNASYLALQRQAFLAGRVPPDFQAGPGEASYTYRATEADLLGVEGRRAMGFESIPVSEGMSKSDIDVLREANRLIAA